MAACDIAIANDHARFRTREVRVGILPALMSYAVQALGPRLAKYLFLTARPLSAQEALQVGLLHQICPSGELDGLVASCVDDIVRAARPRCRRQALVQTVAHRAVTDRVVAETTACIADFRARGQASRPVSPAPSMACSTLDGRP